MRFYKKEKSRWLNIIAFFICLIFILPKIAAAGASVSTVAGIKGSNGFSGDGDQAASAKLNSPKDVAIDTTNNLLYIADMENSCIRQVNLDTGIITTFAGIGGETSYFGDNGPAASAKLKYPQGLAVDGAGNVYIEDTTNYRIRKVDYSTGIINTIAGNGSFGYTGDDESATGARIAPEALEVDISGDNIYIGEISESTVRKVNDSGIILRFAGNGTWGNSGDNGPALEAALNRPSALAVVNNIVYIADNSNSIRKVSAGNIYTVISGLNAPKGLAANSDSSILYVADTGNNQIVKVENPDSDSPITSVIDLGAETLNAPEGLALDSAGNLYIADSGNQRILKISFTAPAQGDINNDGTIDLKDVITVLKLLSGMNISADVRADINEDGKIGIEEAIWLLQKLAA